MLLGASSKSSGKLDLATFHGLLGNSLFMSTLWCWTIWKLQTSRRFTHKYFKTYTYFCKVAKYNSQSQEFSHIILLPHTGNSRNSLAIPIMALIVIVSKDTYCIWLSSLFDHHQTKLIRDFFLGGQLIFLRWRDGGAVKFPTTQV